MKTYIIAMLAIFGILFAYASTTSQDLYEDRTACNCDSIERDYYSDGKIRLETAITNGKIHGLKRLYYQNGKLWREISYSNGLLNGDFVEYDSTGELVTVAFFVNDSLK